MKRIVITTALALSLAAPAFAEAGNNTTAQIVELHFASTESGSDGRIYFADDQGHSATAARIFAELSDEDTGLQGLPVLAGQPGNVSTKGGHNDVASRIFAEMLAAEDAADK